MLARAAHTRVRERLRALVRRLVPGVLVLMYHRIAETDCDPQQLCVRPERFEEHLAAIRARGVEAIPLAALGRALRAGSVPRRRLVITFDDGYADNCHAAAPLLRRYGMPATVFVTAGQTGSRRAFWWDALARICLETKRLPSRLDLELGGASRRAELGEAQELDEGEADTLRAWRADDPVTHERQRLYLRLWRLLHDSPAEERERAVDALLAWAGLSPLAPERDRAMTAQEIHGLAREGLIEIGAHGWSHTPLPRCPAEAQRAEFARSRAELEQITGRPVVSWSYPHGAHSPQTRDAAAAAGFAVGCTSIPKLARRGAHPLELPRIVAGDWPRERFDAFLREYLRV